MRILVLASRDIRHPRFAGGDVYIFELMSQIVKLGHKVYFISNHFDNSTATEDVDGINIIRVRGKNRFSRFFENYYMYKRLFSGKVDVVIEEAEGPCGPFFAKLYVSEPLVLVWHQLGKKIFLSQYGRLVGSFLTIFDYLYASLYKKQLIISPTAERANEIANLTGTENVKVVNPGLPSSSSARTSGITHDKVGIPNAPYFLVLNKIRRYKSFEDALHAFGKIQNQFPSVNLVVAGVREDLRYENELRVLAQNYAKDRIIILTDLSERAKVELMRSAYAFILPSPIEGFSISTLESLSLGVPAIVTSGVPDDVVKDQINGLKYEYHDIDDLAEKMRYLLTNSEVRRTMSAKAKEAKTRFSWGMSAKVLLSAIADRLNHKGVPAG